MDRRLGVLATVSIGLALALLAQGAPSSLARSGDPVVRARMSVITPDPWLMFHRDERHTGVAAGVGNVNPSTGPQVRWTYRVTDPPSEPEYLSYRWYASFPLGDLDGDGALEVVVTTPDNTAAPDRVIALKDRPGQAPPVQVMWTYTVTSGLGGAGVDQYSAALTDADGDGLLDVLFTAKDGYVRALKGSTGQLIWQHATGRFIESGPMISDLDGDGAREVIIVTDCALGPGCPGATSGGALFVFRAIPPGGGPANPPLWSRQYPYKIDSAEPVLADLDAGDGTNRKAIIVGGWGGKLDVVWRLDNGTIVANSMELRPLDPSIPHEKTPVIRSSPLLVDFGEGPTVVFGWMPDPAIGAEARLSAVRLQANMAAGSVQFTPRWTISRDVWKSSAALLPMAQGAPRVVAGYGIGTAQGTGNYGACSPLSGGVIAMNASGDVAWEYVFPNEGNVRASAAVADVDGDGVMEVLIPVGCYGKLYAFNGETGAIEWSIQLGPRTIGSPSLGDLDGDGKLEILVSSYDGNVYALGGPVAGAPTATATASPTGSPTATHSAPAGVIFLPVILSNSLGAVATPTATATGHAQATITATATGAAHAASPTATYAGHATSTATRTATRTNTSLPAGSATPTGTPTHGAAPTNTATPTPTATGGVVAVERYGIFEQTFSRPSAGYANPWEQVQVTLTLTSPLGSQVSVGGFYYLTDTWKARYSPALTGLWSWRATLSDGVQVVTSTGSFDVVDSDRPGFVRQNPDNPFRWVFDDGSPYYPIGIGDCILDKNGNASPFDDWGFDGDFRTHEVPEYGWITDTNVYLGAYSAAGVNLFRWSVDNCSFGLYQTITTTGNIYLMREGMWGDYLVQKLREYGFRTYMAFFGFFPPFPDDAEDPARMAAIKRYVKYVVDRYGAYVDFWELMNEFPNAPATIDREWYSQVAAYLRAVDPYDHPISTSWQRPDLPEIEITSPHWYQKESEFESDLATNEQMHTWKAFGKPVIFGEQGNAEQNWDARSALRMRLRSWTVFFREGVFIFWNSSFAKDYRGGVASNIYLGPQERGYLQVLQNFVRGQDRRLAMTTPIVSNPGLARAYALRSPVSYLAYLHAYTSHDTPTSGLSLTVEPLAAGVATWVDPASGAILGSQSVAAGSQTLAVPAFTADIALRIVAP